MKLRITQVGLTNEFDSPAALAAHFRRLSEIARGTSMMGGTSHKERRFWEGQAAAFATTHDVLRTLEVEVDPFPHDHYSDGKGGRVW